MVKDNLKPEISGFTAFIMVIGTIIGAGIFFKPTAVFGATGTAGLGLLAWLIGGLLALAGGLTIAEIGTLIPETGGMMPYMEKIYGKVWGFILAWTMTLIFYPVRLAAAAVICGTQVVNLFGISHSYIIPIAIGIEIFLNLINALGNRPTDILQNTSTIVKFMPIILIIIVGLIFNPNPVKVELIPFTDPSRPFWQALSVAVLATLYATDGWIEVTNIAGEMKNPGKDLPKSIIGGIIVVICVYLLINLAYLKVISVEAIAGTSTPASDVANILFPSFGGKLITVGILVSIIGSQTGFMRASWRMPYSMGIRGLFPFSGFFAHLNKKTNMPVNSGMFIMVLTMILLVSIHDFDTLADIGSFTIWFFYVLCFLGLFLLRKRWPDRVRPYKVPLYPITPIVGLLGGVLVLSSTILYQPFIAVMSIIPALSGLPVYFYLKKKNKTI